jgi:hypothetical protein
VRRYEFHDFDEATLSNVHVTLYELSDFGVAEGQIVDGIYLANVFNSDAAAGPDRVNDPSGEGVVFYPGEAGWDTGYTLLADISGMTGPPLSVDIDPDPVFAVALHTVTTGPCCVRP